MKKILSVLVALAFLAGTAPAMAAEPTDVGTTAAPSGEKAPEKAPKTTKKKATKKKTTTKTTKEEETKDHAGHAEPPPAEPPPAK